jgi:hypothetical protein
MSSVRITAPRLRRRRSVTCFGILRNRFDKWDRRFQSTQTGVANFPRLVGCNIFTGSVKNAVTKTVIPLVRGFSNYGAANKP